MNTKTQPLINRFAGLLGLPRVAFVLVAGALLTLLLLVADYADGGPGVRGVRGLWNMALEPAIILYIFAIYPLQFRSWTLAVDALRPLSAQPEIFDTGRYVRRGGEFLALLLGGAFGVWVTAAAPTDRGRWLQAYLVVASVAMFALMGLAILDGLMRTRHLARIVRAGLRLDLFDRHQLAPLTRWGQSVALTFVGGTSLSLIFQSYDDLRTVQALVVYTVMVGVSLTTFFVSIWSVHTALVAAQALELAIVRRQWREARQELKRKRAEETPGDMAALYDPIVVLGQWESQVLSASTWPFNPKTLRELMATLVAPIVVYGFKLALGHP